MAKLRREAFFRTRFTRDLNKGAYQNHKRENTVLLMNFDSCLYINSLGMLEVARICIQIGAVEVFLAFSANLSSFNSSSGGQWQAKKGVSLQKIENGSLKYFVQWLMCFIF